MESQNAIFASPAPPGPRVIEPPGEFIAVKLQSDVSARGWSTGEVDNWRDAGWSFPCRRGTSALEVIVTADDPRWFLQIVPIYLPGFLGRILGRAPSATPADTYALANDVHAVLSSDGFSDCLWCWDGPPDENSSSEPTPASR